MSTLSQLNIRLTETLKRSETRNLTQTQRDRALNDALLFDVANYRPWTTFVKNSYTQAVDGVIRIPYDFQKLYGLHYGYSPDTSWETYPLIDQTRFLELINQTATITEDSGVQVLKVYPTDDQGVDQSNKTATSDLGLYTSAGTERLFQTFTTDTTTFRGVVLKLKYTGTKTGTLTAGLYATTASLPTGSALITDSITIEDELSTSYQYVYFNLPYTTTAATEYAIVLSSDATALDATNYVVWAYSATSQIADGTRGVYDGATYTTATGDMYFITYSEVFSFQYSKKLTEMVDSTDTTGLGKEFDEAICLLAAARLITRQAGGNDQTELSLAHEFRYGNEGSAANPTSGSAYGMLNINWDNLRVRTERPLRRMKNIFEGRRNLGRSHTDLSDLQYM